MSEAKCYKMSGTAKHHSLTRLPFVILLLLANGNGPIRTKVTLHASRTTGRFVEMVKVIRVMLFRSKTALNIPRNFEM